MDAVAYIGALTASVTEALNSGVPEGVMSDYVAMCLYENYAEFDELEDGIRYAALRNFYSWTLDFISLYYSICGLLVDNTALIKALALILDEDVTSLSIVLHSQERDL